MRSLVTAGNTREKIDQVRDWGNIFTGNTGFEIARELAALGPVDLVTSNAGHRARVEAGLGTAHGVRAVGFTSHEELRGVLAGLMHAGRYDAVFMTAAVADYRPAGTFAVLERRPGNEPGRETWEVRDAQAGKVKSTHAAIAVLGMPTAKLVDLFRTEWGHRGLLFKFKLEVGLTRERLLEVGRASRTASGADYLVANTLDMVGGDEAGAYLIDERGETWVRRSELAATLARVAGAARGTGV